MFSATFGLADTSLCRSLGDGLDDVFVQPGEQHQRGGQGGDLRDGEGEPHQRVVAGLHAQAGQQVGGGQQHHQLGRTQSGVLCDPGAGSRFLDGAVFVVGL